jgi:Abnormal spindle-like microcephaly-assoc'd, ASPM-SPD-2-Hydin
VLDDIHFPRAPVLDLVLNEQARILRAATYGRGVFQFVRPTGPAISVDLQDNLIFINVCTGPAYLTLQVLNAGASDLIINSVQRLMGSSGFSVLPTPATPVALGPSEELDFTVAFIPTTPGTVELAIIRISSNDPTAPFVDVLAAGIGGLPALKTVIADNGNFGDVCLGSFADEPLIVNNAGVCPLTISAISSSSPEFAPPNVISYPLVVSAGGTVEIPLRFSPASFGGKSATVTIASNSGVHTVAVSGDCPPPRLALAVADAGSFGKVCVGSFVDKGLTLNNAGRCTLSVTNIASSSPEFLVPEVLSYPLAIEAGDSLHLPIRFRPTSLGAKSATLTVTSNDPAGPRTIDVSGEAPPGKLAVTGETEFGCVECGMQADQTVAICNVGECDLHVSEVAFRHKEKLKQKCRRFKIVHNPFPATLRPGSCLNVVIRYRAKCEAPKCCHLVIASDDPSTPIRTLDVSARTCCLTCEPCNPCCCGCCGCSRKTEGRKGRCCECCDCKHRRERHHKEEPEGPITPG